MGEGLQIHPACAVDVDAMVALDRLCFRPGVAYDRQTIAAYLADPYAVVLVATEGEARSGPPDLIAMAIAHLLRGGRRRSLRATLVTIDVHPDRRRQGLGSRMLRLADEALRNAGASTLKLQVAVDNRTAIAFYEHHGFRPVRRLRHYYAPRGDAYLMERSLEGSAPEAFAGGRGAQQ